jgi:hypothetical protein
VTDPINLVLIYGPNALDVEDFNKVATQVGVVAPHINVVVHQDKVPEIGLFEELAQLPTFVFSPMQINDFHVTRGCVYAGRPMVKSEQLLRLELAGVNVPPWTSLDKGKRLDPAFWGEHVIVKPDIGSGSRGVRVMRTKEINRFTNKLEPFRRAGKNFIVQKLVRSPEFSKIRVETLFDQVLHARQFRFKDNIEFNSHAGLKEYERQFITTTNTAEYCNNEAVFELARTCFAAFDGAPLLGLDVMIDESGTPVFIEANPGGNTWHYSSAHTGRSLRQQGVFLEEQLGAFKLAGDVLAKRATDEAI